MDHEHNPPPTRVRKGIGRVVLAVLAIIALVFLGYNLFYVVTNT